MDLNTVHELLAHPEFDKYVQRLVDRRLAESVATVVVREDPRTGRKVVKEPPPGMITYQTAFDRYGILPATCRTWVFNAYVSGGGGFVVERELLDYALNKARPHIRTMVSERMALLKSAEAIVPAEA